MDENRGFLGCAILKSHQIQYYYTARGEGPADPCAPTVRPCSLQTCQGGSSLPGELRRSCGSQDSSSVNETHLQVWLLISGQPPQDTFPFAPPPPEKSGEGKLPGPVYRTCRTLPKKYGAHASPMHLYPLCDTLSKPF